MRKHLYPDNWDELRAACLERAGKQCEWIDPKSGRRCQTRDEQIKKSKRGRRYVVSLYASHVNDDIGNPDPELICLCPRHHMMFDRNKELREKVTTRRRGYQITTTDTLLREINTSGITVTEEVDGYAWSIDETEIKGKKTTAVAAVGTAIHQMRCALQFAQRELQQLRDTQQVNSKM